MEALAAIAFALLVGVSIVVAVRLLALHRRTGAWPELLLGGMLLLCEGIGYPTRIAADRGSPEWSGAFLVVSYFAIAAGFSLLFLFTSRVFRPHARWAHVLTAVAVILQLGNALHGSVQVYRRGAVATVDVPLADILLETGPAIVAYAWTAWESLRYHGAMRRRVKIGLADVTVSNRFLLWGLMGLMATFGVSFNTVAVALHVDPSSSASVLIVSGILGLAQAVLLVLTFVPPRSYLEWVRARGAASGA